MSAQARAANRVRERVVRLNRAAFTSIERGPDGRLRETVRHGLLGQTILLSAQEEARLDALGALAAPGATAADVEAERDRMDAVYRAARQKATVDW